MLQRQMKKLVSGRSENRNTRPGLVEVRQTMLPGTLEASNMAGVYLSHREKLISLATKPSPLANPFKPFHSNSFLPFRKTQYKFSAKQ